MYRPVQNSGNQVAFSCALAHLLSHSQQATLMIYLCCSPFRGQAKGGDFSTGFRGTNHSGSLPGPGPVDLWSTENAKVLKEAKPRGTVSTERQIQQWQIIVTQVLLLGAFVRCQTLI